MAPCSTKSASQSGSQPRSHPKRGPQLGGPSLRGSRSQYRGGSSPPSAPFDCFALDDPNVTYQAGDVLPSAPTAYGAHTNATSRTAMALFLGL
jgi:hypothetical protein